MNGKFTSRFITENPPRYIVRSKFNAVFLTSYSGMAFTGGGKCELTEGEELICSQWINGSKPKGYFKTVDPAAFDKRWAKEEEWSHPQYLGSVIAVYNVQLDKYCERIDDILS